jgi:ubiquinone/menaquinone biosynthesis C-methylase UbiE
VTDRPFWRRADVVEERDFERTQIRAKEERYLQTNPLERFRTDGPWRRKVDRIRRALGDVRGPTLDVGGNTAGESTILAQAGYTMVVGDLNESALTISRARNRSFGLVEPGYVGLDANHLPFADGSFDAVVMVEALHHLDNYRRPLLEVLRVLRAGGLFFTMEPNARDPIRRAAEVRDRFRGTIEKSLSMGQLKQLCQEAGFVTVRIGSFGNEKSSWKLEEVPKYRQRVSVVHGQLSRRIPRYFGSVTAEARKAGALQPAAAAFDLHAILRSPLSGLPLRFSDTDGLWVEQGGEWAFPDHEGIPVLVAEDAVLRLG